MCVRLVLFATLVKISFLTLFIIVFRMGDFRGSDDSGFLYLNEGQDRQSRLREVEESLPERMAPYDGQYYLDIARRGYRVQTHCDQCNIQTGNHAFFPLLPAVIGSLEEVLGPGTGPGSILIVQSLLFVLAVLGLGILASRYEANPYVASAFFSLYPGAAFFHLIYTESLFVCLTIWCAVALEGRRFAPAMVLALLAGLTRPQGIVTGTLVFDAGRRKPGIPAVARVAMLALPVVGWIVLGALCHTTSDSPLAFLTTQANWGRFSGNWEWSSQAGFTFPAAPLDMVGLVFGIIGVGLVFWYVRPLAAYAAACVAMPLMTASFLSFGRFMAVCFPITLGWAKVFHGRPILLAVVLSLLAAMQVAIARLLLSWGYFA